MTRNRIHLPAWLSIVSTIAVLSVAAYSFITPGERVVLAAEPPHRGLAVTIQVELTPRVGSTHNTAQVSGQAWAGVVAASTGVTGVTSSASSSGQASIQPVQPVVVRHREGVLNTLALAAIVAVCLAVLATGIPDVVASLRGRKRDALEQANDGHYR